MKPKAWMAGIVLALALLVVCGVACRAPRAPEPAVVGQISGEGILRATVRIRIVAPLMDAQGDPVIVEENGHKSTLNAINRGLGTLVDVDGQPYLLTHDHYAELDSAVAHVVITDHAGQETTLPIGLFRQAIRYRNNGVLVLDAPAGLPPGVAPGDGERVQPGSVVQLVHRQTETDTLAVVTATVDGWLDFQGIPSYLLRNQAGEIIAPGNSGGGVWFEGQPIGAIHRTIVVAAEGGAAAYSPPAPSHRGYATRLSPARIAVLY